MFYFTVFLAIAAVKRFGWKTIRSRVRNGVEVAVKRKFLLSS